MSMTVLDTDMLTLFQRGDPVVVRRVEAVPLPQLAVTIVSVEESARTTCAWPQLSWKRAPG
jgi:hypothetical protein